MAEIIKWTADTPAFWILLEILETALYFYLVCGLLPNIRDMGRKEKIILYTVFAVTVFLSGMKRISPRLYEERKYPQNHQQPK